MPSLLVSSSIAHADRSASSAAHIALLPLIRTFMMADVKFEVFARGQGLSGLQPVVFEKIEVLVPLFTCALLPMKRLCLSLSD